MESQKRKIFTKFCWKYSLKIPILGKDMPIITKKKGFLLWANESAATK